MKRNSPANVHRHGGCFCLSYAGFQLKTYIYAAFNFIFAILIITMNFTKLDTDKPLMRGVITIQHALDNLLANLGGNRARVAEMVDVMNVSLPEFVVQLREDLTLCQWSRAAEKIHKIKVQFGYLGRLDVLQDLSDWEVRLLGKVDHSQEAELLHLESISGEIDEILRVLFTTRFSTGTNDKSSEAKKPGDLLILIAEDDEVNAMVFETFVQESGYQTVKVKDGHEAVRLAFEKSPDLIFMDVHMPFFSGIDAIRELRAKGFIKPIISLSASTRLNEKKNSLEAGADLFLTKPTKIENIIATLNKYLPVE